MATVANPATPNATVLALREIARHYRRLISYAAKISNTSFLIS